MLTALDASEVLRSAASRNNVEWLRAYGCEIEQSRSGLRVWHKGLPEFRALIVLRETPPLARDDIHRDLDAAYRDGLALYLDQGVSREWSKSLRSSQYRLVFRSNVRFATLSGRGASVGTIVVRRLDVADVEVWRSLYQRVFERAKHAESCDSERWERAFRSHSLQHYVFEREGLKVGLCEFCVDADLAGLYSVGFVRESGDAGALRRALLTACKCVFDQGVRLIYFERLKRSLENAGVSTGSRVLRCFDVWSSQLCE
jgi:hypothetical protein